MRFALMLARSLYSLVIAAGIAAVLPGTASSHRVPDSEQVFYADTFVDDAGGWQTYINGRHGMRVSYPASLVSPEPAPLDGSGRRFLGEHLQLEVFAWANQAGETPVSLLASLVGTEGYRSIDQQEHDEGRLVLSGLREDRVYHEVYLFADGELQALGIEFPATTRSTYDPIVAAIAETFVHGADPGLLLAGGGQPGDCAPYRSCDAVALAGLPVALQDLSPQAMAWLVYPELNRAGYAERGFGPDLQDFSILSSTAWERGPAIVTASLSPEAIRTDRVAAKPSKRQDVKRSDRASKRSGGKVQKAVANGRKNNGKASARGAKDRKAKADRKSSDRNRSASRGNSRGGKGDGARGSRGGGKGDGSRGSRSNGGGGKGSGNGGGGKGGGKGR